MKNILAIFAILAAVSAQGINFNEMCRGLLFASLPHPTDNNLFIGCVQGKGSLLGCSNLDEVFDPFLVSCRSGNVTTNPNHDKICENVIFGWFPYENDCKHYIVCESSRPHVKQCPENSIFNPFLPGCVAGNVETCTFEHHTTPQPPTTTTEATTVTRTVCPLACPVGEVLDSERCQCYCPIRNCPSGQYLNGCQCVPETTTPTQSPTQIPTEVPTTSAPTTLPTTTTLRTTTPRDGDVNISFVCPIAGNGNIPHQNDCSRYFECRQGIRFPMTCSTGKIFDLISKACNDPESSLCASNIRCV